MILAKKVNGPMQLCTTKALGHSDNQIWSSGNCSSLLPTASSAPQNTSGKRQVRFASNASACVIAPPPSMPSGFIQLISCGTPTTEGSQIHSLCSRDRVPSTQRGQQTGHGLPECKMEGSKRKGKKCPSHQIKTCQADHMSEHQCFKGGQRKRCPSQQEELT